MNKEELCEVAMSLIVEAGSAKSFAMKAISCARNDDFERANLELDNATKAFVKAHEIQTKLITKDLEQEEDSITVNLLMVHAQDHLTMALMAKENAIEMIEIYKKIKEKK